MRINTGIWAALALTVVAGPALAQSANDLALRQKAVRENFVPAFEQAMRAPLERSWEQFPSDLVDAEELAAARAAHTREIDAMVERFSARAAEVVVRRVPLAEMGKDGDLDSPGWRAAFTELAALQQDAEREGFALAGRVIKAGCTAKSQPSQACMAMLAAIPDLQPSGRQRQEEVAVSPQGSLAPLT